jgi:molybdopterin/thiamine biosynthesis adenylyltransferase
MRPMLKAVVDLRRESASLWLDVEPGRTFELDDDSGVIEAALRVMDGSHDIAEIAAALQHGWPDVTEDQVTDLVAVLDGYSLVESGATQPDLPAPEAERYTSNLAFFAAFATLQQGRHEFQDSLRAAHVVQLGVGGLGSSLLFGLAGSGVGRITLVDCDRVELKNLTRQFLYAEADIGRSKVCVAADRARQQNSAIQVRAVEQRVSGPSDVAGLLSDADLVVCAIDTPPGASMWVSDACVAAGVPMVAGGMAVTRLMYWSVWPGHSGCLRCWQPDFEPGAGPSAEHAASLPNRTMGPMASLLAGFVGTEILRYLTGYAQPVSAGRVWFIDLISGACTIEQEWAPRPDCPSCAPHTVTSALS